MTISSINLGGGALASSLTAQGLSSSKAAQVQSDLDSAVSQSSALSLGGSTDDNDIRAKLDAQIDADVKNGVLTEDDAALVRKTLDDMDSQAAGGSATTSTAESGTASAHSGGSGGGSSEKTELSRAVTISGSTKTTTITYTDGTSESTDSNATPSDVERYGDKTAVSEDDGRAKAEAYLARLEPGTLVDRDA